MQCLFQYNTVNLRSKGPARKRNSPLRDIDLGPNKIFVSYSYIYSYKGISVYGKNLSGPMKSLRAKFNCTHNFILILYILFFAIVVKFEFIGLESTGYVGFVEIWRVII